MGCCSTICGALLKWTFFLLNLIFFLCGGALLGVGIWLAVDSSGITAWNVELPSAQDSGSLWAAAVYTSIAIGGLMFIICFLGCCGAISDSSCLLNTYVVFLVIAMCGQLSFAILATVFQSEIGDALQEDMTLSVGTRFIDQNATDPRIPSPSYYWNVMQVEWECCGSLGHADYVNSKFTNTTGYVVPWSCCTMTDDSQELNPDNVANLTECRIEAAGTTPHSYEYLNEQGCFTVIDDWTDKYAPILIGIGFGFVIFYIIGIIFGCCMITSLRNKVTMN